MRKQRGFTLIELLIVVAIIAILAAIAVPNFLEAQVRSKVSRVRSDQRSLATALESYYIDNNVYPALSRTEATMVDRGNYLVTPVAGFLSRTFRARHATQLSTLTTPVAYITSYPADAFGDVRGTTFRYYHDIAGWILGSWGPDTDQRNGGSLGWDQGTESTLDAPANGVETIYTSQVSQPSLTLIAGTGSYTSGQNHAHTYDPTNGTISPGDVWRVKQ